MATITTCLLEFDSIAQAISHSDENDYAKLQFALNKGNSNTDTKMKRQGSEATRVKGSAGNLAPTVTTK